MLSHWTNWIADCFGHRAPKRRLAAPRFRGQLESLESRNVLSATIGVVSFDVVAVRFEPTSVTVVAVPEFHPALNESGYGSPYGKLVDGPRDAYGSLQPHAMFFPLPLLNRADHWLPRVPSMSGKVGTVFDNGGTGGGLDFDLETDNIGGGPTGEIDPAQMGRADNTTGGNSNADEPYRLQAPTGTNGITNRTFRSHVNFAAGDVAFAVPDDSSDSSTSPSPLSAKNYDTAFEELASDSLLLASDADGDNESMLFGDDDELDKLGGKDGEHDESADHVLSDGLAESLDALQRERAAVDAVLAELHEIELTDRKTATDDARRSHSSPANSKAQDFADRFFIASSMESAQSPYDTSAGGMVMLAATGDANASAFELAAPTTTGIADHGLISLAVEAPIGLYQAVDVGVRPEPAITAQNASTAEPAAKVQTNVSAENAPAKKSEQPAA